MIKLENQEIAARSSLSALTRPSGFGYGAVPRPEPGNRVLGAPQRTKEATRSPVGQLHNARSVSLGTAPTGVSPQTAPSPSSTSAQPSASRLMARVRRLAPSQLPPAAAPAERRSWSAPPSPTCARSSSPDPEPQRAPATPRLTDRTEPPRAPSRPAPTGNRGQGWKRRRARRSVHQCPADPSPEAARRRSQPRRRKPPAQPSGPLRKALRPAPRQPPGGAATRRGEERTATPHLAWMANGAQTSGLEIIGRADQLPVVFCPSCRNSRLPRPSLRVRFMTLY